MPLMTTAEITSFVNPIYNPFLTTLRENTLMAGLVTGMNATGDAARKVVEYGTATTNQIAETDDLVSQQYTPTLLSTLTPLEYGSQFFMTDRRIDTDPFEVRAEAARELGMSMADKIENNLLGLFSSLTGGTVGAAGTVITWGYFYAMLSRLRAQHAPQPYAFVCHPYHWHMLAKAVSPATAVQTNAPNFQDQITRQWWVGSAGPVDIYTSTNLTPDSSDDAYVGMFSRPAIALDLRRSPRIEPERDASRRGIELNMSAVFAHGTWRPKLGIQGLFDASTPSS